MSQLLYILPGPIIGYIDVAQTSWLIPLSVPLPAGWRTSGTRYRVELSGHFQCANPGDLFTVKFWIGETILTMCVATAIRPGEQRTFHHSHKVIFWNDNLHMIDSTHTIGLHSCGSFQDSTGNSADTSKFTGALPVYQEKSRSDSPLITNDDWSKVQFSFHGMSAAKVTFRIDDCTIEKL